MKLFRIGLCFIALACDSAFAALSVTDVSAQQRYPWNGMVDVSFTITGEEDKKYAVSFVARDVVGGTNLTMKTLYKSDGTAAALTNQLEHGTYKWVWDAAADLPDGFNCERVAVEVNAERRIKYVVRFHSNGGSGTMADQAFAYDESKSLSANSFTKSGYAFFGWSLSTSAVRKFTDSQVVGDISGDAATVDLYAIWTRADIANGLDCPSYPWMTDSTNPWRRSTETKIGGCSLTPHDGSDLVMSSGAGGGVADSWIQTTVVGPATCSFYYATYSAGGTFQIYVDSSCRESISCATSSSGSWFYKTVSIASGVHKVKLNYHHPGYGFAVGGNGVRIDQFTVK